MNTFQSFNSKQGPYTFLKARCSPSMLEVSALNQKPSDFKYVLSNLQKLHCYFLISQLYFDILIRFYCSICFLLPAIKSFMQSQRLQWIQKIIFECFCLCVGAGVPGEEVRGSTLPFPIAT